MNGKSFKKRILLLCLIENRAVATLVKVLILLMSCEEANPLIRLKQGEDLLKKKEQLLDKLILHLLINQRKKIIEKMKKKKKSLRFQTINLHKQNHLIYY
jgi:hypothetical protein